MNKCVQITVAVKNKREAEKISVMLIRNKLAACVQVLGPVKSVYTWKGKIKKTKEYLCFIKADKKKADKIVKEIKRMHSYKVPEVIVTPIIGGNPDYLRWVVEGA